MGEMIFIKKVNEMQEVRKNKGQDKPVLKMSIKLTIELY